MKTETKNFKTKGMFDMVETNIRLMKEELDQTDQNHTRSSGA